MLGLDALDAFEQSRRSIFWWAYNVFLAQFIYRVMCHIMVEREKRSLNLKTQRNKESVTWDQSLDLGLNQSIQLLIWTARRCGKSREPLASFLEPYKKVENFGHLEKVATQCRSAGCLASIVLLQFCSFVSFSSRATWTCLSLSVTGSLSAEQELIFI